MVWFNDARNQARIMCGGALGGSFGLCVICMVCWACKCNALGLTALAAQIVCLALLVWYGRIGRLPILIEDIGIFPTELSKAPWFEPNKYHRFLRRCWPMREFTLAVDDNIDMPGADIIAVMELKGPQCGFPNGIIDMVHFEYNGIVYTGKYR